MTIRFATPEEISRWDEHILANPDKGNVFQSHELAQQKKLGGWTPRYIMADTLAITILEKSFLGYKLWYLPKGPGIRSMRELGSLLPTLKTFAGAHHVFALKIEPELLKTDETLADFRNSGLLRVRPIQPNASTVLVDISEDLETVMAHLNQKGRHAIHRAERDGVTVRQVASNDKNCRTMYDLLAETAAGSFSIRDFDYYKTFWQRFEKAGYGQLFFAYVDGKVVAGAYAFVFGTKSTYKDGASVRERTAYGASHLLQWKVIEWAKSHGSVVHDLCGAPPSDQINNPDHPHYGIGRFKTSFNKTVTDYVGCYDLAVNPGVYKLWAKIGERFVLRLHRLLHRENWY